MKTKISLAILTIAFLFSSCVEVKFEEPQPRGIKNIEVFPEELQGDFLIGDKDTLRIFENGLEILNDSTFSKDQLTISDQFVLRKWKKSLFINIKDKEDSVWTLVVFKPTKKNSGFQNLTFKEKDTEKINKLRKITEVKDIKNEDGGLDYLLVNPSRRELKKILKLFPSHDLGSLQKIDKE